MGSMCGRESNDERPLTWDELSEFASEGYTPSAENGPASSQARLRLFGCKASAVRVTLFRDSHGWCPYCEKVWLWLEEKRIPYRVRKVSLKFYGTPEGWYKQIVPSGVVPAVQIAESDYGSLTGESGLSGKVITESDVILAALEDEFGKLGSVGMDEIGVERRLEKELWSGWMAWLCQSGSSPRALEKAVKSFEARLGKSPGVFLRGDEVSVAECICVPTVERIAASLYYYKGWTLRDKDLWPNVCRWLEALEKRDSYRGMKCDFHTLAHCIPPQLGGCFKTGGRLQKACAKRVNTASADTPETSVPEPANSRHEAVFRVVRHFENCIAVCQRASRNPKKAVVDYALRCALTSLVREQRRIPQPLNEPGADRALLYLAARICVPRDMSLWAARRLRKSLAVVAAKAGSDSGPHIPTNHRRDQDPRRFRTASQKTEKALLEIPAWSLDNTPSTREHSWAMEGSSPQMLASVLEAQAAASKQQNLRDVLGAYGQQSNKPFLHGSLFEERENSDERSMTDRSLSNFDRGNFYLKRIDKGII